MGGLATRRRRPWACSAGSAEHEAGDVSRGRGGESGEEGGGSRGSGAPDPWRRAGAEAPDASGRDGHAGSRRSEPSREPAHLVRAFPKLSTTRVEARGERRSWAFRIDSSVISASEPAGNDRPQSGNPRSA